MTTINGTTGNDTLNGSSSADTINGLAGNDIIDSGDGADVLIGGKGNDTLLGGNGNDAYVFNIGDGDDTINNFQDAPATDKLLLGLGFSAANIILSREGDDLVISFTNSDSDSIRITQHFSNGPMSVPTIQFADGTKMNILPSNLANVIYQTGTEFGEVLNGYEGKDVLLGNGGDDFLEGFGGNDKLEGGAGNDVLSGSVGADTLIGGKGNDTLMGGDGADTYLFNLGDGHDTINNHSSTLGADKLVLGADFTAANIRLIQDGTDLVITFTNSAKDSVRIQNQFIFEDAVLPVIQFADGSVLNITRTNLANVIYQNGSAETDFLDGYEGKDVISGKAGSDRLSGYGGNDLLDGGIGNDGLDGYEGNDTLIGGKGDDFLWGGTGADTYTFNKGDGRDMIMTDGSSEGDILVLGEGFSAANIRLNREHMDLIIRFTNSPNDSIRVERNYWDGERNVISKIRFSDGSVLDISWGNPANTIYWTGSENGDYIRGREGKDVLRGEAGSDDIYGEGGNDTLYGGYGDDSLDGGEGVDLLIGGGADDIYVVDNEQDVITEFADQGYDTVQSSVNYTLGAYAEALVLTGTAAVKGTGNGLANTLTGNDSSNVLDGAGGADTLIGGAGSDILIGGAGNDTYQMEVGGGVDTVVENGATAANADVLAFLSGVEHDQLWFRHVGNNLEVSIIGTGDKVVVQDWYSGSARHVEQIKTTDDNKTLLDSKVENLVAAMSTMTPPPLGQSSLTAAQHAQLDSVIAASWS